LNVSLSGKWSVSKITFEWKIETNNTKTRKSLGTTISPVSLKQTETMKVCTLMFMPISVLFSSLSLLLKKLLPRMN